MDDERTHAQSTNLDGTEATQRREWSAPQLQRLDIEGTRGFSAKNLDSQELATAYASPPLC